MTSLLSVDRRSLLVGALASAGASAALAKAKAARFQVNVGSNQGAENASMQQLMLDRGYLKALSLDARIVESKTISGPMDALLSGDADICMISAFVGVLPAIEQGMELRLVGAALLLPALAVYTKGADIRTVKDLAGKKIAVGPTNGLLHILMQSLLRQKGVDPTTVQFVNAGSNAQALEAVVSGKVDAGLSGVAGLSDPQTRVLDDGKLWQELPDYTYQPAYASVRAIREKPEALARCLAAYTKLYRYLSSPGSHAAYIDARRKAAGDAAVPEGEAVWDFVQKTHPYAVTPGLTPKRTDYLQQLNVAVGVQTKVLPFDQVADASIARMARKFL